MKNPLITIIIPVYKVEQYLEKCVDSVINQDYPDLEIFLVDDGSPDQCGEICESYAKKDSRIKVIHKKNGGLSDARNVAIDVASGEYITFVDSDDYVSDDYVSTLYGLIKKNDCKISASGFIKFGEDDELKNNNKVIEEYVFSPDNAIKEMFYQKKFDTSAWAKLYHRSLFSDGIRYPVGLLYEDLATTYKLFRKSDKIAFSTKESYFYLIRSTSIEGAPFSQKKIDSTMEIITQLESDFDNTPQFNRPLSSRILNFSFHILLSMPFDNENRLFLINKIKSYRSTVIKDKEAKIKSRIICLLSYFGINNVTRILKIIK
ncbi:glycosyltransferase family 2 protein [Epilithonimonas sp.]|uniref:glycosyltransferase family 2 protein n=1 Tax=Epilithonimonas sp. TaxID=2894511 RepID=UPI00289D424C|nr:glycosyltransferase family 2 protein [Epilithonimonas sp.]